MEIGPDMRLRLAGGEAGLIGLVNNTIGVSGLIPG